jgi:hypothetical protein
MMHRLLLVIGLGVVAIGPTLADVVDVTVNGSISGSGYVTTYCLVPECDAFFNNGQFATFPFSFSATNITQLGVFGASGGASSTGPPETDPASIQASVSENTTATADALEITLSQDTAPSDLAIAGFSLNDVIAVSFNLTEESKIQLTDDIGGELSVFSNSVELLDSTGNVILVGPCEVFGCSVSMVLPPGTYQLDDQMFNSGGSLGSFDQFFSADLNASFTPVVPEPRWTIIATLLAALLGGYVMSRRETVKRGEVG